MKYVLQITQLVTAIVLIGLILLQPKGVGLGKSFGGSGVFYRSRRGVEKIVFNLTIFFVVIFLVSSILSFLFS